MKDKILEIISKHINNRDSAAEIATYVEQHYYPKEFVERYINTGMVAYRELKSAYEYSLKQVKK
jgi:hypothetical protein